MATSNFNLPAAGKVVAIGANGDYLRHFVAEFIRRGGAPERLHVIRDLRRCPDPVCSGIGGAVEHAIEATELNATIGALGSPGDMTGCVFAWHHLVSANVIDAFAGNLLNLHYGDLPRYRGAGGGSWQVLNGETQITAFVHCMTPELDRGYVLMREMEPFATDEPYPRHVKEAASRACTRIIGRLASLMHLGGSMPATEQDEDAALYFPRLHTASNGWIDFSWPSLDILKFVRAFSDPYPGASFRYRGACYRVRTASLRSNEALHPFSIGLIVNRTSAGLHVAARDGVLLFSDIRTEAGAARAPATFRIGDRLWTSPDDLLSARKHRPAAPARS